MEGRGEENDKGELQSNEVRGKGRWTTLGPGGGKGEVGVTVPMYQVLTDTSANH